MKSIFCNTEMIFIQIIFVHTFLFTKLSDPKWRQSEAVSPTDQSD